MLVYKICFFQYLQISYFINVLPLHFEEIYLFMHILIQNIFTFVSTIIARSLFKNVLIENHNFD